MKKISIVIILLVIFGLLGYYFRSMSPQTSSPQQPPVQSITPSSITEKTQLANPASVLCARAGGTSEQVQSPQGTTSYCVFPTGERCEEWQLFRGECTVANVSTSSTYTNGTDMVKVIYRLFDHTALVDASVFQLQMVDLKLAESASGARYLSADKKIEFWEHQDEGTLSIDGKQVFIGKKVK